MNDLDDPARADPLRKRIKKKSFLRLFYQETYGEYAKCLAHTPPGIAIEIGSGAGFANECIAELITSDALPHPHHSLSIDATRLPFKNESLRGIVMLNVFHHIPDVRLFLEEASRCLMPGGRIFIRDQHVGWLSTLIFTYFHHEPFNPKTNEWSFTSTGPVSGANGALAWIVFNRDRKIFEQSYPLLSILRYLPHSPFRYWLAGGLKRWTLVPGFLFHWITQMETLLLRIQPDLGSFVDIEIVKKSSAQ